MTTTKSDSGWRVRAIGVVGGGVLWLGACGGAPPKGPSASPPVAPRGEAASATSATASPSSGDLTAPVPVVTSPSASPAAAPSDGGYFVEGRRVDREVYERFRSSLEEVEGTWYCDEMIDGGETGWEAVDAQGKAYLVRETTDATGSTSRIIAKPSP